MNYWSKKKVLVTGGKGFLGRVIVDRLHKMDAEVIVPTRTMCDLRDQQQVRELFKKNQPDVVIHAAANCGGIGYMQEFPADVYYDNIMMNSLVIHEAYSQQVKKLVSVGTVCSYPKFCPVPFREGEVWSGYPEETNAAYGLAKKMMMVQLDAYASQYQFNGVHLLLANLYGPGDNFDLKSSHVIPALIRKFLAAKEAKSKSVTLWGSGKATREFLYVDDAAEAILLAAEHYHDVQPINVGVGEAVSIKDLAALIQELSEYSGDILWDTSKPDGQPARWLDVSMANKFFSFQAGTSLRSGLRKTIDWYVQEYSRSMSVVRHEA